MANIPKHTSRFFWSSGRSLAPSPDRDAQCPLRDGFYKNPSKTNCCWRIPATSMLKKHFESLWLAGPLPNTVAHPLSQPSLVPFRQHTDRWDPPRRTIVFNLSSLSWPSPRQWTPRRHTDKDHPDAQYHVQFLILLYPTIILFPVSTKYLSGQALPSHWRPLH
jgi:hypothetical protein